MKQQSDKLNLPQEFVSKMKNLLQDEWEDFLDGFQSKKYQALRINILKDIDVCDNEKTCQNAGRDTDIPEFDQRILHALHMESVVPVLWAEHGYYYDENIRPGKHAYHEMGLYYIQEPSAMSAAELLDAKPGDFVLDLCAAPGGKAAQLAAALRDKGLLLANEIHPARSRILSQNIERMGIGNALVLNEEPKHLASCFPLFFDKILVDAPCSGEGMFRKNPEAMQEWSADQVLICAKRQADIMESAAIMLKAGGRLVYSTCTFSPEEDEMVIAGFLHTHPEFMVEKACAPYFAKANPMWADKEECLADTFRLWPHKLQGEGHYVAVLKKKEVDNIIYYVNQKIEQTDQTSTKIREESRSRKKNRQEIQSSRTLGKEQQKALDDFYNNTLTERIRNKLTKSRMVLFKEQLYALPDGIASVEGLKVQRAGLHIGTFKKDRFEPSHALALYLKKEDCRIYVNLSLAESRSEGYFRGEGFFLKQTELFTAEGEMIPDAAKEKGFCLVCIDGFSAGWGKLSNGQVKNHYPKGLRKAL